MKSNPLQQLEESNNSSDPELAANIIRKKLDKIYGKEPSAKQEIAEVAHIKPKQMSKHQHYMDELSKAGLSLHEIQIKWHEYYAALDDTGKREVWQEFYSHQSEIKHQKATKPTEQTLTGKTDSSHATPRRGAHATQATHRDRTIYGNNSLSSTAAVKKDLLNRVQTRAKPVTSNHHVKSLVFGFSTGLFVILILSFSFFNERFVTPFIRPSSEVSATPIIVNPNQAGQAAGPEAKIFIPKINVEAPVVYDEPSIEEAPIQKALERGVVHYATTPNPGEKGNAVIFGHSSGNILNSGKYKFAFILLKSLDKGDTFMVDKDGKRYVYKVYEKYIVPPTDVSILGARDKPSTMTLVTCDPPGMSTNRLIIVGEQIYPDPTTNKESSVNTAVSSVPKELPSNSPSLWQRLFGR